MAKLRDLFKIFTAAANDFTRLDRTCNNCCREIFKGKEFFPSTNKGSATLLPGEQYFCEECFSLLPKNDGYICDHCGRSTTAPTPFCDECTGFEWSFDMARSPFYYAPPVDKFIRDAKYSGKKYFVEIFEPFVSAIFAKYFFDADILTFVPMTKEAEKQRGYNQSELLCKAVSEKTGYPYAPLTEKSKATEHQAKLNRTERLSNLKGSFKARNTALIEKKRVVLVDDVLTTGATAESVAEALKNAGAEKVYLLTIASVTEKKTALILGQEQSSSSLRVKPFAVKGK